MKLLILTQTFPLTPKDSTAHFMLDFAQGLTRNDNKVTVLVPFHPKLKPKSFGKIKVVPFKYILPDFFHLLGFGRTLENDQELKWFVYLLAPMYIFFGIIELFRTVRKEKIDIINAHWIIPNGFIGAVVSIIMRVPLFITLPGSDVYLSKKNLLFRLMAKMALKTSSGIISNSSLLLKDLQLKGVVIPYPVPPNLGKRTKNKELKIATAGRDVEKKGIGIIKKLVPNIEVISGLRIDEFREKLLSVDIFIALSIRDSKGNLDDASLVVQEAMAAGCSVITSDLPGYRTIIDNGKNGFLVSPRNAFDIKRKIDLLINSEKLRILFGKEARKTTTSFTPGKIAAQYFKLFQKAFYKPPQNS